MRLGIQKQLVIAAFVTGVFTVGILVIVERVTSDAMVRGPMYKHLQANSDLVADVLPPPAYALEPYLVSLELARTADPALQAKLVARGETLAKEYEERYQFWSDKIQDPTLKSLLLERAATSGREVFKARDQLLIPARRRNDEPAVAAALEKIAQAYSAHRADIDEVVARANIVSKQTEDEAGGSLSVAKTATRVAAVLAFLGPLVLFGLLGRWLARRLAAGMAQLRDGGRSLHEAAQQVATASRSLAQGASTQAASIEETSAALEEISTMTKRNAGSSAQSSESTSDARARAERSMTAMGELVTAMDAIKGSSDEIAKIIKVIDEIAFQTNMLALNAAVEAARAGEAGMGFAVVADEVRSLAQRSAQAANETAAQIDESIRRSNKGVEITRAVHGTLSEIVTRVRKIDELSREITSASQEQARGIAQTNSAVAQMDRVTQHNAALADEVSTSASQMTGQAAELQTIAAGFEEVLHGSAAVGRRESAARPPAPPAPPAPSTYVPPPRATPRAPSQSYNFVAAEVP